MAVTPMLRQMNPTQSVAHIFSFSAGLKDLELPDFSVLTGSIKTQNFPVSSATAKTELLLPWWLCLQPLGEVT